MNLEVGYIGLSGGRSLIQKAIRFFIQSDFSHSFTILKVDNIFSALETTSTIVCVSPIVNKYYEKNWVQIWKPKADLKYFEWYVYRSYSSYAGIWYGYLSYIWFIWRWFWRLFGIEKRTMWNWCKNGITCTTLTCLYLENVFPQIFKNLDIYTISPQELLVIMQENPDKFEFLGWYKGK